ncbi:retropepsin-like aspartic protease family protein [Litorisediminicola beolgyonensis]|uniref:TIGR02281 family clan AA aspartic protease n=1 Tax=Litorisediminicola beolgyonensis TaxID=1173614 RepID=A0ABW3ZL71_9RHOB
MCDFEIGNLLYLVLLGSALVFWAFVQNREALGKKMQALAAWGLIFLGVIAAVGLWEDIRQTVRPSQAVFAEEGRVVLPQEPDGHFYVTLDVNEAPVRFMVDTGATGTVLTERDAERAGLDPATLAFYSEARTANGVIRTAPVTLDNVRLGPFLDTSVPAYVNPGEMEQSLLGMSYLGRFDSLQIRQGELILER